MSKSAVILRSVEDMPLDDVVAEIFSFCGAEKSIRTGMKVLLKPNLCTERKEMIRTANTSIGLMESVIKYLKDHVSDITICESDGARYTVEEVYENNGIYDLVKRYGIKAVNLSRDEKVWLD